MIGQRKQVRVGGVWLSGVAPWGDLQWSYRADGGCWEASWAMDLPRVYRNPAFMGEQLVEIFAGPVRIWRGFLYQWQRSDSTFVAQGYVRALEKYAALSGSPDYDASSVLDTAIDRAIASGLDITRPVSLSSTAYVGSGSTSGLNYLHTLADAVAEEQGKRVVVNELGEIRLVADPTTPSWQILPGVADVGPAQNERASTLVARYIHPTDSYSTYIAEGDDTLGRREQPVDLTPLGVIDATKVASILSGMFTLGADQVGLADQIEATTYQVTTLGGQPAWDTSQVRAGQMIRVFGGFDDVVDLNGRTHVDLVVGESRHTDDDSPVTLIGLDPTPVDYESAAAIAATRTRRRMVG